MSSGLSDVNSYFYKKHITNIYVAMLLLIHLRNKM